MFRKARKFSSVICHKREVKGFNLLLTKDKERLREEFTAIAPVIHNLNSRRTLPTVESTHVVPIDKTLLRKSAKR